MSIIISKGGQNARKVEESGLENEDELQRYISANPGTLPLDDLKAGVQLLVVGREFPTNSGPIDVLAIDGDGDLYIIETKLYGNPDKRRVIAQVLDYGASLWRSRLDPTQFVGQMDIAINKDRGAGLVQAVCDFYGKDAEAAGEVVEAVKRNLKAGHFRFIVLMDRLHDPLKDLILFLNERSEFAIYAVEMEFYRHEGMEIVIPKLFGGEARKPTTTSATASRRWDEASFLARITTLPDEQARALRVVYEFCRDQARDLGWGNGRSEGEDDGKGVAAFSPKFAVNPTKSPFTLRSNGGITLNYGWWKQTPEFCAIRDRFVDGLREAGVTNVANPAEGDWPALQPADWVHCADAVVDVVRSVIVKG